ncbi:MAG: peptide ABC transporter substrate-binding protein [Anaerolineaceae bacterium]|jgi:oligopeptide transport system substrate-binding protein|nr:peptide ABC transporter substrate-binding protein [Anaerolineaceae bacterium]
MRNKTFALATILIVASMVLAACQPAPAAQPEVIVQTVMVEGESQIIEVTATPPPPPEQKKVLNFALGPGDIPTLDPALGTDTSSIQVIIETFVGLTRADEVTNVVKPGMATSWDISEDGTVYTFNLRDDVPWVKYDVASDSVVQVMDCEGNPRMVTAYDFEYGVLRTLAPATASDYAYVLNFAIVGGDEYNAGEGAAEDVGIKAIDETTVEMTFKNAAAYNAAIAGMWIAFAQPEWLIEGDDCTEARGDRWTETGFHQGYGPFAMKEWVHDSYLTMVKNPFWPGTDEVPVASIEEINLYFLDASPGFAEYEAGGMDVVPAPLADIDRIKSDPTLSEELVIAPDFCTYYYGFNTTAEFVDDVRVRRALSMGIDRQSLIDNVTKGEQIPAQWFSRPGLAGAPTPEEYPDLGVKFDAEQGKAVLQEYLDEMGITVDDVNITLMFNTSDAHRKIAEAIQQMWQDNLGLTVQLVNQEWAVYLKTIKSADTPQIWRLGWCLDYADANNFIFEVMALGGSSNPDNDKDGLSDGGIFWGTDDPMYQAFEDKMIEAARELDPDTRTALYAEAEEMLVWEKAAMIPIYWYTRTTMTKPYVTRTFSSGGHEHFEMWDIDMSGK